MREGPATTLMSETVVILGCGYTGRHLVPRLKSRGLQVIATSRSPESLADLDVAAIPFEAASDRDFGFVPPDARLLYSIPALENDPTPEIVRALGDRPSRVVYLSTTGVYGDTHFVDENTPAAPRRSQDVARLQAENAILSSPCSSMVLRPAAIYGPERGVHVSMREGRFRMAGDGSSYVSRIHVEDLALHCEAALFSDMPGAWPVADDRPCTTREIAEYCSRLFGVPMPPGADPALLHHTRQSDRQVNGRAVRRALGIELIYSGYAEGIKPTDDRSPAHLP